MTITLDLPDSWVAVLVAQAEFSGRTKEQVATDALEDWLSPDLADNDSVAKVLAALSEERSKEISLEDYAARFDATGAPRSVAL